MASLRRPPPRSRTPEASENDPDGSLDAAPLPPPRSPLLCIPDPSQIPRKRLVCELDVPKVDHSQLWAKGAGGTPRSAQSTPTRALSRVHATNGVLGSGNGRLPLHGGGRERVSSSRAVRAMADVKSCPSAEPEVRHFELYEDPSFWNDHNVQVLIRIRPINNAESASQGHGRCLRQESSQTLTWTGHPETRFTFDHVACETVSQANLFRVVGVPMVENCMSGYNSCMFAYGQTGSGKTHTMMGEIWEMDSNSCKDRGMTPRIFEYMFMRISEEEENLKNGNLKYCCKCSYLEIYNEQITDLLDPSSTNLQLREDSDKGVYVENLKEHDVKTVKDVIELLLQGTANRKMAATSMNSVSSRSHSVFTCSIESQWEKDSMKHIRFGRLNLVDLAGSERQKSSGAEGDRLKEAANINRSLSTLGLVIMTLVDIANGKHRHIPYRDSRLTFLLQDSLGENSKTTIIANVSPSICSANETLSTLKFAQRAKLIRNNAKVNEDASGDVMALQGEIWRLKEQLNIVIKHQNVPRPLFSPSLTYETANESIVLDDCCSSAGGPTTCLECSPFLDHKMTFLESALAGTLRREKMADAEVSRLEAENEHMKQLVLQMEADVQRTKMMLHLRDETIRRLELHEDGLASGNEYVMEKNSTLTPEIQMLQDKSDTNPELTQFSMENIKLLEQLRVLQDFHQKAEREILLNEISQLRNEHLNALEGRREQATLTCERESQVECTLVDNVLGDRMMMRDEVTSEEEDDENSECDTSKSSLHAKKSQEEAEAMRNVDVQFQNAHHLQVSQFYEMERIREQVEEETAQTILNLQEELAALQQELYSGRANGFLGEESSIVLRTENTELKEKLVQVSNKNTELLDSINAKDTQINGMADEWEKAIIELTSFLLDGCESLEYASDHINNIIDSFPQSKSWISDHVERAMKVFVEKEKLIVNLKKSLEDAQKMGLEMTSKLNSLKGATMAITEIQQLEHDETTNELLYLQALLDEKTSMIQELENIIKCKDDQLITAEKQANAALIAIKRLNEVSTKGSLHARAKEQMINGSGVSHPQYPSNRSKDCQPGRSELQASSSNNFKEQIEGRVAEPKLSPSEEQQKTIISEETKFEEDVFLKEIQVYIEDAVKQVLESENELVACCTDTQNSLAFLASETNDMYSSAKSFIRQMAAEIGYMKKYFTEVVECGMRFLPSIDTTSAYEAQCTKPMGSFLMMQLIESDLPRANGWLRALKLEFDRLFGMYRHIVEPKNSPKKGAKFMPSCEDNLMLNESELQHLGDGLKFSFNSLSAAHDQLTVLLGGIGGNKNSSAENNSSEVVEIGSDVFSQNALSQLDHTLQVLEQRIMETDANCTRTREMLQLNLHDGWRIANEKTRQAATLFIKFEEAQETMKEADLILNELMSANETARLETERWKVATQVLQLERASLAAEVEQMRDAIVVDAKQSQILIAEVNAIITEMPKLLSELEQMFQIMQNHAKTELKAIYFDIRSFATEMRECVRVSTIWSETLFRKIIWEKLPSTVQQHQNVHEVGGFSLGMNPVRSWEVTERKNGLEAECNLSQRVLNTFQKSLADIGCNSDTGNFERLNALCDLKDMLLQTAKVEMGKTDLINDMNLGKGAMTNKILFLDQFITFAKKMSLQHQSSGCIGSHLGNECTTVNALVEQYQGCDAFRLSDSSVSAMHPKLQLDIIHDVQGVPRNDDALREGEEEGTIIDIHVLLSSIQQLRAHCEKVMLVMEKKRNSESTVFNNKDAMLISAVTKDNTKTLHGNQLMQAVDKLGTGLVWLVGLLCSELDAEIGMDTFPSLLGMLFQGICNLEENAHKFVERQSSDGINHSNNLVNILSVKRDQAPEHVHFRGVQESISTDKYIKHEGEGIPDDLDNVHDKLAIKITKVDAILQRQKELDSQLPDRESALSSLRSELKDTKSALSMLVNENEKLVLLLEDVNREKMDVEEQLKDQEKLTMNLEREILCLNASVEERVFSSVEEIAEELRLVSHKRDQLQKEIVHLNEKLDMASALSDENEAVAIEARQNAEESKVYAEEKEREVKVLENSVEELEDTINMLEKKVYDMGEDVERYRLIREDLELELQTLRARVFTAHTSENFDMEDYMVEVQHNPRQVHDILQTLSVSKKRIKDLENERACQAEEIKQYKEHISEIILHSEAQSSHYQQKFQALEAMTYEVKTCPSISDHTSSVTNKTDKSSFRQRGSGSPFRCISSLVQQMNSEKDQELSVAKNRIEELEVLASDRQKQVCMLSARLAAVDNMTHDVIRDLLEVKLDMTNYANLIDLKELHKLVQNGLQENDQSRIKDEEILRLKAHINALTEENDSWIEGRKVDILATEEKLEKLQYRDQLLTAQNEMLKLDKANLTKRLTELDEVIKKIVGSQSIQELIQPFNVKESNISRQNNGKLARRLAESDKLLLRAKNEPAWSTTCRSSEPFHQQQ